MHALRGLVGSDHTGWVDNEFLSPLTQSFILKSCFSSTIQSQPCQRFTSTHRRQVKCKMNFSRSAICERGSLREFFNAMELECGEVCWARDGHRFAASHLRCLFLSRDIASSIDYRYKVVFVFGLGGNKDVRGQLLFHRLCSERWSACRSKGKLFLCKFCVKIMKRAREGVYDIFMCKETKLLTFICSHGSLSVAPTEFLALCRP